MWYVLCAGPIREITNALPESKQSQKCFSWKLYSIPLYFYVIGFAAMRLKIMCNVQNKHVCQKGTLFLDFRQQLVQAPSEFEIKFCSGATKTRKIHKM